MKFLVALAIALLALPGAALADDVANASYLCAIIDATGLTTRNAHCPQPGHR